MFVLDLNLGDLSALTRDLQQRARAAAEGAAGLLAAQIHAHILEKVQEKLHSTRETYANNLYFKEENRGTWVVGLKQKARWIEDGMTQHEMISDLLKSASTRTSKAGVKYLSVPFQHNKAPTRITEAAKTLQNAIRTEMKTLGIPYGKAQYNLDGTPRTGLLYRLDIINKPKKYFEGAGQGWGPIGDVRQGYNGVPFLKGVRIYQRAYTDERGRPKVSKQIMTFRTVSSLMMGSGRWVHPGLRAQNFFDEAARWAEGQWENKLKPEIFRNLGL